MLLKMTVADMDLLGQYARQNSEDAFAEIVRRHLGLVYSAALRQVRSPQLAEEVAQSVFTDLARNAHRLAPDTILTAWLYQVTRRTAIDVVRREARRQLREQIATEMNAMNATPADWTRIEPILDEAMDALDETDRAAVLLRYFENKSLREVGATLGTSDDAAQKRVSRAVERLREFFAKRGITVGASGLVVVISANAVQAAPVGLAVTISTAATLVGTTIATAATATATKVLAMTTLQKVIIGATLAAAVGTGIYEARQASRLRDQVQTVQQQQAPLAEQIGQLSEALKTATNQIAVLRSENARLNTNTLDLVRLRGEIGRMQRDSEELAQLKASDDMQNGTTYAEMKSWLARLHQLKKRLNELPDQKIPELQFVDEATWLDIARDKCETDDEFRRAFSQLRNYGEGKFAGILSAASKAYGEANNGQFPMTLSQLKPFFPIPVDDTLLQRFEIVPAENVKLKPPIALLAKSVIVQRSRVDQELDQRWIVYRNGMSALTSEWEIQVGPFDSPAR
jgi:RNA polymerase sigma factor (sigma-70 family)